MKKSVLIIALAALTLAACNRGPKEPTRDELALSIDSIEQPLMDAAQFDAIDTAKGNSLIALYIQFADAFATDTMAPVYLQRAAQVAGGMGLIDDMVAYYDRVIDNYPDYAKLDECYYEKGIALDNAGRKEEARKAATPAGYERRDAQRVPQRENEEYVMSPLRGSFLGEVKGKLRGS